ncbi:cell wall protein RBR3-like [Vicia villosa]|uniref:cell wall protein RBR3-like n=1 Tax=Vicia villosa TaxID=3911 RepID=UPI00273BE240|nr:cell wall protein RBR3-like [Vicia villosa]
MGYEEVKENDVNMEELKSGPPYIAVARKRQIKEAPVQKGSGTSRNTRASGSDSVTTSKKPTSSKPPAHSKRKAPPTADSDDEDKSPSRTRQMIKKRQKTATPSAKGKGSGTSKLTSSSDKVSSEDSPLKATSTIPIMESHNSSPENIPTKDDAGTATSDLKASSVSQHEFHVLSPVLEDNQPLATIIPTASAKESHSNGESPPTHQDETIEENPQCSNSGNAAGQPTGSKDTISEQDVAEETSKLATPGSNEISNLGTTVSHGTTSKQVPTMPTPSKLEQLKKTDPASFLKTMMSIDNATSLGTSSTVLAVEISEVIVLLSSLIEQLQSNILRKRDIDGQLTTKMTSHSSEWEAANDATKKVETLKLERSKNQREYKECETNIKAWKKEIEQLEGKIKDAQSRQVEIQKTNQDELTEVAQSGI